MTHPDIIKAQQDQKSSLYNIFFSVLLPVLILNKLSDKIGPTSALILALSFPLGFGGYEYFKTKKANFISILGFLNVLITGGFALMNLSGIWFAIKEASFPFLIGSFVLASNIKDNPFIETILLNPAMMNLEKISQHLEARQNNDAFHALLKRANLFLAFSFFFSAVLNFVLAMRIFTPMNSDLSSEQQAIALNAQVAEMTYMGLIVIAIPSFVFLIGIFYYFMTNLKKLTGLSLDELTNDHKKTS